MTNRIHYTVAFIFVLIAAFYLSGAFYTNAHPNTTGKLPLDNTPSSKVATVQYADTNSPHYQKIIKKLDSFYAVQIGKGFNGSVLLGEQGKVFYERYYGYANKATGSPLRYNTPSQLASTSKTFTGAAILYLYQHRYLDIYDDVRVYLPDFPYKGITIKMLLNHRSGLPDYLKWYGRYVKDTKTEIDNDAIMSLFYKHQPHLNFTSNTRFKYSNSNYVVLASIIEKVTAMKYKTFMHRYIFEPLGMRNTFVYDSEEGLPSKATLTYRSNWSIFPNSFADGVYGDKGIYSTVRDMYIWDQSFYQNKFLSNKTLALSYGPCSFEKPGIKNYGLGWRMLCYPSGNKIVYHNGWWHGNNTVFYRFIKENMTFIILGNKYNTNIYRQAKVLYSLIKDVPVSQGFEEEEEEE